MESISEQTRISTPSSELLIITDRISTGSSFQPDLTIRKKRLSKFPNPFSHFLPAKEHVHAIELSACIHSDSASHLQHCISFSTELRV